MLLSRKPGAKPSLEQGGICWVWICFVEAGIFDAHGWGRPVRPKRFGCAKLKPVAQMIGDAFKHAGIKREKGTCNDALMTFVTFALFSIEIQESRVLQI